MVQDIVKGDRVRVTGGRKVRGQAGTVMVTGTNEYGAYVGLRLDGSEGDSGLSFVKPSQVEALDADTRADADTTRTDAGHGDCLRALGVARQSLQDAIGIRDEAIQVRHRVETERDALRAEVATLKNEVARLSTLASPSVNVAALEALADAAARDVRKAVLGILKPSPKREPKAPAPDDHVTARFEAMYADEDRVGDASTIAPEAVRALRADLATKAAPVAQAAPPAPAPEAPAQAAPIEPRAPEAAPAPARKGLAKCAKCGRYALGKHACQ